MLFSPTLLPTLSSSISLWVLLWGSSLKICVAFSLNLGTIPGTKSSPEKAAANWVILAKGLEFLPNIFLTSFISFFNCNSVLFGFLNIFTILGSLDNFNKSAWTFCFFMSILFGSAGGSPALTLFFKNIGRSFHFLP